MELNEANKLFLNAILKYIEESTLPKHVREENSRLYGMSFANKNFNTLKLSLARRKGNTSLCLGLKESLGNSCYFVETELCKMKMIRQFGLSDKEVFTQNWIHGNKEIYWLQRFDYVILDSASNFKPNFIDELYHVLSPKLFLFIG
jgi:hypothetical protein